MVVSRTSSKVTAHIVKVYNITTWLRWPVFLIVATTSCIGWSPSRPSFFELSQHSQRTLPKTCARTPLAAVGFSFASAGVPDQPAEHCFRPPNSKLVTLLENMQNLDNSIEFFGLKRPGPRWLQFRRPLLVGSWYVCSQLKNTFLMLPEKKKKKSHRRRTIMFVS